MGKPKDPNDFDGTEPPPRKLKVVEGSVDADAAMAAAKAAAGTGAASATEKGRNEETVPEAAKRYLEALDEQQAEIDAIMEEAREKCQPYRDEMKAIKKAGAEKGIPKKVLGSLFAYRRNLDKASRAGSKLGDEHRADYVDIKEALGDFMNLPLGLAAVEAAGKA